MPRSRTSRPSSRNSRSSRPAKTSPRRSRRVNNFIASGYDAIVVNAQNPAAFKPVIKRAKAKAGVVLVAFDNILDTEDAINVNVDQKGLGVSGPTG
jgi:ribose transport system substrate-binding protein